MTFIDNWSEWQARDNVSPIPTSTVNRLRGYYPEMAAWPGDALFAAWTAYGQVAGGALNREEPSARDVGFLGFLYVSRVAPGFTFQGPGLELDDLLKLEWACGQPSLFD